MAPEDDPSGKKGDVLTVELTVMGIPCLGLNGAVPPSSITKQSHFRSQTTDQAETDRYWNAIVGNGSEESERLVPRQMGRILADHAGGSDESDNPFRSLGRQRAFDAMM